MHDALVFQKMDARAFLHVLDFKPPSKLDISKISIYPSRYFERGLNRLFYFHVVRSQPMKQRPNQPAGDRLVCVRDNGGNVHRIARSRAEKMVEEGGSYILKSVYKEEMKKEKKEEE